MNRHDIANSINRSRMAKGLMRRAKERDAAIAAIRLVAIDASAGLHPVDRAGFMAECGFRD